MEQVLLLGKSLHIIGAISWFAGLFYWGRILVFHAEADLRPQPDRGILTREYIGMEQRVYKIIVNPGMMLCWIGGLLMIGTDWWSGWARGYFISGTPGWLHLKLLLVVGLIGYQLYTKRKIMQPMEQGERPLSGWQLRLWNEVPTFFLISIPFIAVYGKGGNLSYLYLAIGVSLFCLMVYRGAVAYRNRRGGAEK